MSCKARRAEPSKSPAWARCLITSVGMRIAQAAVSARVEASMWTAGAEGVVVVMLDDDDDDDDDDESCCKEGGGGGRRRERVTPS